MDPVVYWYKSEVYFWRSAGSLFWSVLSLPALTVSFVFLSQLSILHPFQALTGFWSVVFSFSFVLWLMVLTAVLVAIACTATFSVVPEVTTTRIHGYLSLARVWRWPHLVAAKVGGATVAWVVSHFLAPRFQGLTTLVHTHDRDVLLLNEAHLFLVLSGAVAGLVYYSNFYLSHLSYLAFPLLQRDKYFRVRNDIVELAKLSIRLTWRHVRVFCLGYWLIGGLYRSWVVSILNVEGILGEQPLDSLYGLMDCGLLWASCTTTLFIIFSWTLTAILYRVYHTQRLEIPVLSEFSSKSRHCLPDAMASHSTPLLQHLAYLDLREVCEHSAARRREVLSLSQPGGHPHTWRSVCASSLQQLEALTQALTTAHLEVLASLPMSHLPAAADKIFPNAYADKSLTYRGTADPLSSGVPTSPTSPQSPQPEAIKTPIMTKLLSGLRDKPGLSYFLAELPDTKSGQLFASCQNHIWAIEALSALAVASYKEDEYGVVQQTLSAIFNSLIALQDCLERYFKLQPLGVRRGGGGGGAESTPAPHVTLCMTLRTTLKTALYRLTTRFHPHIGDLGLSPDCVKRLRPFMDYRE